MRYRFIEGHRAAHRVEKMAKVLGVVSRSGYYAWKGRPDSARRREERALVERIRQIQQRVKFRYGSPRVARLLAAHRLGVKPRRKYRATTDSKHNLTVAENLLAGSSRWPVPTRSG
jgi:putative transposase